MSPRSMPTLVYDMLISYDPQLAPHPRLATSWQWSSDARRLTLRPRQGAKFHTGRPFTSDDAKFNLEHLRDPAVASQWRNGPDAMHVSAPVPATLVIDDDMPSRASSTPWRRRAADPQTLDATNAGRGFVGTGPLTQRTDDSVYPTCLPGLMDPDHVPKRLGTSHGSTIELSSTNH